MKRSIRHIIAKTAIILMTVMICLPCTVKQEIKQALDVPISQLERFDKQTKAAVCQSITIDETRKGSDVNHENESTKYIGELQSPPIPSIYTVLHNSLPQSHLEYSTPVPIFVLHEQYLI